MLSCAYKRVIHENNNFFIPRTLYFNPEYDSVLFYFYLTHSEYNAPIKSSRGFIWVVPATQSRQSVSKHYVKTNFKIIFTHFEIFQTLKRNRHVCQVIRMKQSMVVCENWVFFWIWIVYKLLEFPQFLNYIDKRYCIHCKPFCFSSNLIKTNVFVVGDMV